MEKALADPPDLILMDVSMPRMTGFEACRRLKADERTHLVPLVLVTGLVAREDRIQGIAAGCDDFLTKPVDSEQLMARTRSLLRAKALIDDLEQAENVLVSLATALDAKDNYTRGHSERVADYAEALGGALGPRPRRAPQPPPRRAPPRHRQDRHPRSTTSRSRGRSPPRSTRRSRSTPSSATRSAGPCARWPRSLALIRGHHERLDGRGYPDGLKGDAIPLPLRCLSVADVYDALTSDRSYRKAHGPRGSAAPHAPGSQRRDVGPRDRRRARSRSHARVAQQRRPSTMPFRS